MWLKLTIATKKRKKARYIETSSRLDHSIASYPGYMGADPKEPGYEATQSRW